MVLNNCMGPPLAVPTAPGGLRIRFKTRSEVLRILFLVRDVSVVPGVLVAVSVNASTAAVARAAEEPYRTIIDAGGCTEADLAVLGAFEEILVLARSASARMMARQRPSSVDETDALVAVITHVALPLAASVLYSVLRTSWDKAQDYELLRRDFELRVCSGLHRQRELLAFPKWCYKVGHSAGVNFLRTEHGKSVASPSDSIAEIIDLAGNERRIIGGAQRLQDLDEGMISRESLRDLLKGLGQRERDALLLQHVYGESQAYIAACMGVDETYINNMNYRTRKKIRNLYKAALRQSGGT